MPIQIIHRDITRITCDAVVNPTDCFLSGSGGTDRAVHAAAGAELDRACAAIGSLETGAVAVTDAYRLPCRYIIHTVGPVWQGGGQGEAALLKSCYRGALAEVSRRGLRSVAFPLISAGTFGFPKDRVLRIAVDTISDFLLTADADIDVYICILDRASYALSREDDLHTYVSAPAAGRMPAPERPRRSVMRANKLLRRPSPADMEAMADTADAAPMCEAAAMETDAEPMCEAATMEADAELPHKAAVKEANAAPHKSAVKRNEAAPQLPRSLAEWLKKQDDTFAVMLLKLIDKKGMTDVQCYKKANVSKGTFWKINNDPKYRPSRETVIAFAIALELTLDETEQLLKTVGFSLSDCSVFDRIIKFYLMNGIYDVFEINAALFRYDQPCLGC